MCMCVTIQLNHAVAGEVPMMLSPYELYIHTHTYTSVSSKADRKGERGKSHKYENIKDINAFQSPHQRI